MEKTGKTGDKPFLATSLPAQSNCDFQKLINDGKAAAKKENYELALNKFNSARRCDPDKGAVIDTEVEKLFVAINQKKKQFSLMRMVSVMHVTSIN